MWTGSPLSDKASGSCGIHCPLDMSYTNVFRVNMQDFKQVANNSLSVHLRGDLGVFGAVPASQVR